MRQNLAQLFGEHGHLALSHLQPRQLRHFLNFLFGNFHSSVPFHFLRGAEVESPTARIQRGPSEVAR